MAAGTAMHAGDDTPGLAVVDRTLPAARGAVVTTLLNIFWWC